MAQAPDPESREPPFDAAEFKRLYGALPLRRRLRIRVAVSCGRAVADPDYAPAAVALARRWLQSSWTRRRTQLLLSLGVLALLGVAAWLFLGLAHPSSTATCCSYTDRMTHRVGPKGQVVIPKDLRQAIGLEPGDEVEFALEGRGVYVRPARSAHSLEGSLRGMDLVGALEADRRSEPR